MFKNRSDVHFSQDNVELTPLANQTKKSRKGNSTAVVFHFVSAEQEYDNFKTEIKKGFSCWQVLCCQQTNY